MREAVGLNIYISSAVILAITALYTLLGMLIYKSPDKVACHSNISVIIAQYS